ncbi:hypothetical protein ACFO3J_24305 [Streptomyces polygonati]|uniref:Uncharacterized protein n=1 Tax=Streptomyces polygonati TaxID=1617087 RepID=A0ABV8HRA8_9ACTN
MATADGAASIRPGGPLLRGVVTMRLPNDHGSVTTPQPTMEYGGLPYCPVGSIVRIDIGDAQRCLSWDADKVAGAVRDAAEVEITGTDWQGVAEMRTELAAALDRLQRRRPG